MSAYCRGYDATPMGIFQIIHNYISDDNIINMEILIKLMCKDEDLFWEVYSIIMHDPSAYEYNCFNLYFIMEAFTQNECFLACLCKSISKWVKWHSRLRLLKDRQQLDDPSLKLLSSKLIEFCALKTQHSAEEWYYLDINNQDQGPFSVEVMQQWFKENLLQDCAVVRKKNTSHMPLSQYFKLGIAAFLSMIPPNYRNDNPWIYPVNAGLVQSSKQRSFVKYHMVIHQKDTCIPLISWGRVYEEIVNKKRMLVPINSKMNHERYFWLPEDVVNHFWYWKLNPNPYRIYSACSEYEGQGRRTWVPPLVAEESSSEKIEEESIVEEEQDSTSSVEYEDA